MRAAGPMILRRIRGVLLWVYPFEGSRPPNGDWPEKMNDCCLMLAGGVISRDEPKLLGVR